jgi:hypothetical protein
MMIEKDDLDRARNAERAFRIKKDLYVVGSLERGVTVYNQQVRAHNLVWALWELEQRGERHVGRVAVVGGGITGLTTVAALLALFKTRISVSMFEQLLDICPIQQGADGRWLHPRIYDWPIEGSRAPSASLPVLDWSEGRASDVARTLMKEFGRYCEAFAQEEERLFVYLGLRHFQIDAEKCEIAWVATKARRFGAFFSLERPEGGSSQFDTIILATGFGLETLNPPFSTASYWRNEQLSQPFLDGSQRHYIVSGYGDGALVDLCRLTVERFRQDTIIYELFSSKLEGIERRLSEELETGAPSQNIFSLLEAVEQEGLLDTAKNELRKRIRKDTNVILHLSGKGGEIKTFQQIFGPNSSFLNRLMTYLLYRSGAFGLDFGELPNLAERQNVPDTNVLCRYGAKTIEQLNQIFSDPKVVESRLMEMKANQKQTPKRLWAPGVFPHYFGR